MVSVWFFATSWTVAHQAPLPMEFCRQKYWSGLPFPTQGIFPTQGLNPRSLKSSELVVRFFTTSTTWEAQEWPQGAVKITIIKSQPWVLVFLTFAEWRHEWPNICWDKVGNIGTGQVKIMIQKSDQSQAEVLILDRPRPWADYQVDSTGSNTR